MKKLLAACIALLACAPGFPQSQPAVPLVVVVAGPPGNPGDTLARALSAPLAAELGQAVVVENKPGAAGTIGLAAVARARPDGNTIGVLALQSAAAPALVQAMQYDTLRDLAPVRQLSWVSNVLVSRADGAFLSVQDVINAGRLAPLTFASGGNGTPAHLAAALFAREAGVAVQHVPFNGAAGGVNAVLAGHVQLMFAAGPAVAGLVQSGKLRMLALTAPERLAMAPATPTLAESGYGRATMRDWHGLVAPAGTAPERIERIAAALDKVLAADVVRQRLATAGLEPVVASSPAAFRSLIASELVRWSELVRSAGVKLE